jgi:hypothetical protein
LRLAVRAESFEGTITNQAEPSQLLGGWAKLAANRMLVLGTGLRIPEPPSSPAIISGLGAMRPLALRGGRRGAVRCVA